MYKIQRKSRFSVRRQVRCLSLSNLLVFRPKTGSRHTLLLISVFGRKAAKIHPAKLVAVPFVTLRHRSLLGRKKCPKTRLPKASFFNSVFRPSTSLVVGFRAGIRAPDRVVQRQCLSTLVTAACRRGAFLGGKSSPPSLSPLCRRPTTLSACFLQGFGTVFRYRA